jgi:chemotaxis protein histidine kinase CheA
MSCSAVRISMPIERQPVIAASCITTVPMPLPMSITDCSCVMPRWRISWLAEDRMRLAVHLLGARPVRAERAHVVGRDRELAQRVVHNAPLARRRSRARRHARRHAPIAARSVSASSSVEARPDRRRRPRRARCRTAAARAKTASPPATRLARHSSSDGASGMTSEFDCVALPRSTPGRVACSSTSFFASASLRRRQLVRRAPLAHHRHRHARTTAAISRRRIRVQAQLGDRDVRHAGEIVAERAQLVGGERVARRQQSSSMLAQHDVGEAGDALNRLARGRCVESRALIMRCDGGTASGCARAVDLLPREARRLSLCCSTASKVVHRLLEIARGAPAAHC